MAKPVNTQEAQQPVNSRETEWSELVPQFVGHEDEMSPERVKTSWEKMYRLASMKAPTEKQRAAFRLAVYAYSAVNGTTRVGDYAGVFVLADGTEVPAAVIPRGAGQLDIRRFFRGNMKESYDALKGSGVLERDARFVAKAAALGIRPEEAFAMADWFADCPYFTPGEKLAHEKSLKYALSRSRRTRGGRPLEEVEAEQLGEILEVQGRQDAPSYSHGEF